MILIVKQFCTFICFILLFFHNFYLNLPLFTFIFFNFKSSLKQAEAAVLEVVPKLRSLNIKIEVPKDYFTDKVKSDTHMVKVMAKNEEEKKARERIEKIKRLRQERKLAKMRQVETKLAKLKEKKDFNQKVKNYKKGKEKNLDFLNNNQVKNKNKKISKKSTEKKKKYGYGGQKKRSKYNTKESASDVSGFRSKLYSGSNKKAKSKRPSKNKRMKMKAKV